MILQKIGDQSCIMEYLVSVHWTLDDSIRMFIQFIKSLDIINMLLMKKILWRKHHVNKLSNDTDHIVNLESPYKSTKPVTKNSLWDKSGLGFLKTSHCQILNKQIYGSYRLM
jgi:hypothetical protein